MNSRFEQPRIDGPVVKGFRDGGFLVGGASSGGRQVTGGLLLTPEDARDWPARAIGALTAEDAAPLLALAPPPEFVLFGSGNALAHPPRAFAAALDAAGIGMEAMDSRAAARAWGVLRAEGRWIAAALLPL